MRATSFLRSSGLALALAAIGLPALAQELPNLREARRLVFAERGAVEVEVIDHDSLSDTDRAILQSPQLSGAVSYYGAIAIAPGMGLASEATVAAANFHDEENARRVALDGCEAQRSSGPACIVVLVVRPEGWEPGRSLQLNTEATAALRGDYRRLGRSRAMAISEATGQWGIGADEETAVANCGQDDCRVVVLN
ncbi:5-aminolevulic acid synthase [Nioella ostreopsis]|uniref:5-aminolevulic acid synthase n=1 Tax=Nioella ostreopsis TaxID=2448479 RepID=UPI000FDA5BB7|nr:5-aminolevulic acid synthase [Nioella ostreopsis]